MADGERSTMSQTSEVQMGTEAACTGMRRQMEKEPTAKKSPGEIIKNYK